MKLLTDRDVYEAAFNAWGYDSQFDMAIEECAELIQAIQKMRRSRMTAAMLADEVVDVEIMMEQLRLMLRYIAPDVNLDTIKRQKLERLKERIKRARAAQAVADKMAENERRAGEGE